MSSIIKVNTIQDAGGNSLLVSNGSGTLTTNNINVKDIDWQAVVTSDTTMVAGRGYFVDATSVHYSSFGPYSYSRVPRCKVGGGD